MTNDSVEEFVNLIPTDGLTAYCDRTSEYIHRREFCWVQHTPHALDV